MQEVAYLQPDGAIDARKTSIKQNILLQFIFPSLDLCTEEQMYVRYTEGVRYDYEASTLIFDKKGRAFFDTYFNSLSVGKYKRHTVIEALQFRIAGNGKFKISFRNNRLGFSSRLLYDKTIELHSNVEQIIDLSFYQDLDGGMLFFHCECLSEAGTLTDLAFVTPQLPKARVRMGIVITHFKREKYVLNAIKRLKELLTMQEYANSIKLIIVDNSNTLPHEDFDFVEVIPNKNYGGSGGFTRGLMQLMQENFTHCLFMDDDASCELESIRRTYTFLQYANHPRLSIAGALLMENVQFIQYENGGSYSNGIVTPLKIQYDMRSAEVLLHNEKEERVDYGAWWFFAFPIAEISVLSFPFFVRGDDITFSIQNDLRIITLNGICSWGEDFTHKIAAMERYMTMRSTLQMAIINNPSQRSKKEALSFFRRQVIYNVKNYNYDRAQLMCEAMRDVLKGNSFWLQNINMDKRRAELQKLVQNEKTQLIADINRIASGVIGGKETLFRKFVRVLSLNGHLLPESVVKKDTYKLNRYQENTPGNAFRKQTILYYDPDTSAGYYVNRSLKRFVRIFIDCLKLSMTYSTRFDDLVREHEHCKDDVMSHAFWQQLYRQ
jgi:galactofuranosylgalactofuranosylrhamnosyl-N-acetylglucosaminyl-diphospho-decaprenol beta-1,5/1,6-galactofuranosyltransferase